MNTLPRLVLVTGLAFSSASFAEGSWLDSLKGLFGSDTPVATEVADQAPSVQGMIDSISGQLGVSPEQAKGGLGSLMNYAKQSGSSEEFSALSNALPGLSQILSAAPSIADNQEGVAGLLNKAAQYNDTLKNLNLLKQQFEALGLSPEMIASFVQQAQAYLDTPQGQQAKQLLMQSLSKLL